MKTMLKVAALVCLLVPFASGIFPGVMIIQMPI